MIIKLWGVSLLKICCSFASKLSHFEVFEETALGRWGFDCEVWGDQSSIRGHLLALWWALCFKSHLHHRHLHWHQHYVWKGFRPDCCSLSKWAIGNYSKLLPPAAVPLVIITDQVCQGGATYVFCWLFLDLAWDRAWWWEGGEDGCRQLKHTGGEWVEIGVQTILTIAVAELVLDWCRL